MTRALNAGKTLSGILIVPLCLNCFCCGLTRRGPTWLAPRPAATRWGANGKVNQQVLIQEGYIEEGPILGPHGPMTLKYAKYKYFVDELGKEPIELNFLAGEQKYVVRTVEGTSLWIAVGTYFKDESKRMIKFFLFDDHLIRRRDIEFELEDERNLGPFSYRLTNGNRTVLYWKNGLGIQAYDVVADTTAPWKDGWPKANPNNPWES